MARTRPATPLVVLAENLQPAAPRRKPNSGPGKKSLSFSARL
jgi:hypothetical protein